MSAAFFNHLADPKMAVAISAGTHPAERVHPEVINVMRDIGIDLADAKPQKLTQELAQDAYLLVTMGCGDECPYVPGLKRADWPLQDPKDQSADRVTEIRNDIRRRIADLISHEKWGR